MGIPYKKKSSKNLKLLELYYDFPTKILLISEKAQFKGFLSCIFMPIALPAELNRLTLVFYYF